MDGLWLDERTDFRGWWRSPKVLAVWTLLTFSIVRDLPFGGTCWVQVCYGEKWGHKMSQLLMVGFPWPSGSHPVPVGKSFLLST